jgi:AcrR family transcriptional regulator
MPTRTRKPAAERREEIAEAALRLIGEGGTAAVTTTRLAEAVGVSSGAPFRHFGSLDAVLVAAIRLAAARIDETLPPPDLLPLERLECLAQARVALFAAEPGLAWLLRSDAALSTLPPEAVADLKGVVKRSRAFIRQALEEAVDQGLVRGDVPMPVLMLAFTSTVHALIGLPGLQALGSRSLTREDALEGLFRLLQPGAPPSPRRQAP